VPALRCTVDTLPATNPDVVDLIVGRSTARTVAGVGASAADAVLTLMVLYLSENTTDDPADDRAHPSGTATVNREPLYGTNAWLSGMSPGGLVSTTPAADALGAFGDEGCVCRADGDVPPFEEPHAVTTARASSAAPPGALDRRAFLVSWLS